VKSDSVFEKRISTLLKWRKRKKLLSLLVWSLALALILNAVALGFQKVFYLRWDGGCLLYLVLILISFGLALGFHLLPRKNLLADLIEIDSRLELKDRLSTAFEYLQRGRNSSFREQLITDAGRVFEGLPRDKLYPHGFSAAYVLIPLFTMIIIGLFFFDFSPSNHPKGERTQVRLVGVGKEIERFSKEKIREIREKDDQSLGEPYRQLEELAKGLQNQSLRLEKLLLALGEMNKEALAERLRLTRKLEKELNAGSSPGNPFPLPQEITTPKDLERLTDQLKDLFDGSLPDSLAKDLARIDENLQLEQFLEKTAKLAISPGPPGNEQFLLSKREKSYPGEGETGDKSEKLPSSKTLSPMASEKEPTSSPGPPKPGQGEEEGSTSGKRPQRQEGDDFSTIGRGKGTGEKLTPFELKMGKGPSFKEGGAPSGTDPGSTFQVRTLPLFGKTKNDQQENLTEIHVPNREELEAVLQKEKIPQEYREYIKQYFLSVRQEKGKKQNEKSY
jgi:hypothetical protein